MMIKLNITPIPKPRMTRRTAHTFHRYWAYANELQELLQGYELPSTFGLSFFLPMPKRWSKKKRAEMNGAPHQQKPDWDNLAKGFQDAICKEDDHVYRVTVEKYWIDGPGFIQLVPFE